MNEAIKTFQTLDSNSIISLIILKENLSCFENIHACVYKVSHCDKFCMVQPALSVVFI